MDRIITRKVPRNLLNIVNNMNIMRLVILLELKVIRIRIKTAKSNNVRSNEEAIVINFDIPKCVATYLHRIGRSGRWGRKGIGINFVTKRDIKYMKEIEQHYATEIKEMPINWADTLEKI